MDLLNEGEGDEYCSLNKDHRHAHSSQKINGNRSTAVTGIAGVLAHKEHNSYIDNYTSSKMQNHHHHKDYDWNTNINKNKNNNLFKQHSYLRN